MTPTCLKSEEPGGKPFVKEPTELRQRVVDEVLGAGLV